MSTPRKKLIEVSLPLEAINKASAREKSIRHGHPSTLHLWWARRPLAACRAVLFAQLVDDPSAWPEEFPTEEDQARERTRLHKIIAEMVPWEATNNEHILNKARYEIARSIARGRGDAPPAQDDAEAVLAYLAAHAPPVCDPFCGGGSIPLEAQRLGLRAYGSDLNPVAVLVSKATCEIPPKFAGRPPVNPERDQHVAWKGAQGLADDIRYYGKWMRDEAHARIGHLYPKVTVTEAMAATRDDLKPYVGKELTVIAWLWARTVASPDPMMRGAHVPLVHSFVLSSKKGKEAIVIPLVDNDSGNYRFTVKARGVDSHEYERAKSGTHIARGANFTCLMTGSPISGDYIKAEGMAGRISTRLIAIVAEGSRGRVYLNPTGEIESIATTAEANWLPEGNLPTNALGFRVQNYGMSRFSDLFTNRQLLALSTFADLISETRERIAVDARAAGMSPEEPRLAEGGSGLLAYADAVATYLGFAIAKKADLSNSLCMWEPIAQCPRHLFSRQAIPMVWDFAEANPFSSSSGSWLVFCEGLAKAMRGSFVLDKLTPSSVEQMDVGTNLKLDNCVFATDPPYYDNVPFADISDFFYVWHRRALGDVWPRLFRRILTPKDEELVATPFRHGGKDAAERFFMEGMGKALANMHSFGGDGYPVTIYYAFKQAEVAKEGLTSSGWATFLQGVVDAGYVIDGTWPVRTENASRMRGQGSNVLASSIVLVCRKRSANAVVLTRREFVARLRAALPDALTHIRSGGVGPVDMAQAALGPGMAVFSAAVRVLEPDDTPMAVRTAIALINQVRDEISGEEASGYDADTRFCIDWFEAFGMGEGESGDAITMANAQNIGLGHLEAAGVFSAQAGKARLLQRTELKDDWDPTTDPRLTDWECAQHLARVLESPAGGIDAAAGLLARMDPGRGEAARMLAYRLYDICERKGRATEARTWNMLAQEWPALEAAAADVEPAGDPQMKLPGVE